VEIQVSKKINFIKLLGKKGDDTRVLCVDRKAEESTYKCMAVAQVEYADSDKE
jgi:hypothetical protein